MHLTVYNAQHLNTKDFNKIIVTKGMALFLFFVSLHSDDERIQKHRSRFWNYQNWKCFEFYFPKIIFDIKLRYVIQATRINLKNKSKFNETRMCITLYACCCINTFIQCVSELHVHYPPTNSSGLKMNEYFLFGIVIKETWTLKFKMNYFKESGQRNCRCEQVILHKDSLKKIDREPRPIGKIYKNSKNRPTIH